MVAYRLYCLDGVGRFVDSDLIEAETDDEALEIARGFDHGVAYELWDHERFVGRVSAPPTRLRGD